MKKLLNIVTIAILLVIMSFAATACKDTGNGNANSNGGGGNTGNQEQELLDQEIADAKEAFSAPTLVFTYCNEMSSAVYSAWHYAIYYADSDKDDMISSGSRDGWDEYLVTAFWYHTNGMGNASIIRQAMENVMGSLGSDGAIWATALSNVSYSVAVAKEYNKLSGGLTDAKNYLDEARDMVGQLSEDNKQSTRKDDLADFYSTLSSYYNIIESPSGNYNSYGSSISSYKTDISNKISKLELYLG